MKPIRMALWLVLVFLSGRAAAAEYELLSASYLGGTGDEDSINGACIQSDGTIVLGGELAPDAPLKGPPARARGVILRLSPDGRELLGMIRFGGQIMDMAIDGRDNIYVAAGSGGVVKLNAAGNKVLFTQGVGDCKRVDAAEDGHCAAIAGGRIHIIDPNGRTLGSASGKNFTEDVCIDGASKTVIFCGFRNARDKGVPVQIAYIRGLKYDGATKYTLYSWSTDPSSDRYLNKPTNNMADTRGYRCAVGRDGKLYVGFEAAGGNHMFRYHPREIMQKVSLAGGDRYNSFHNSRAEHKLVFCRFEPDSGDFLGGQNFCGRLSSGRANAVRVKDGDIWADKTGRVYVAGAAAAGLPLTLDPSPGGYTGGGFLAVFSPDLTSRPLCTRLAPGKCDARAVYARQIGGKPVVVWAGGEAIEMHTKGALQEQNRGQDGFVAVAGPASLAALAEKAAEAKARKAEPTPSRGNGAGAGAARRKPSGPDADTVAEWTERLRQRVKKGLTAGRRFALGHRPRQLEVRGMNDDGELRLSMMGMEMKKPWSRLNPRELTDLALDAAKSGQAEDHAVAAFFLLQQKRERDAFKHLRKAGAAADQVRAIFQ